MKKNRLSKGLSNVILLVLMFVCNSMRQLQNCIEATQTLFDMLRSKLIGGTLQDKKVGRSSIALMLYLLYKATTCQPPDDIKSTKKKVLKSITTLLNNWIKRNGVLKGSKFGGDDSGFTREVQVCILTCIHAYN